MDTNIFFTIILLLTSIGPSTTQSIRLTNLASNPGILALQEGYSFRKLGEHKLFHIIDLDKYEPIFRRLKINIIGINSFGNYSEMTDLLSTKLSNTQQLFFELKPKIRPRRGLFNFIGTGIKTITGNLDNNDLIEISKNLEDLNLNSKILINENNEQRLINQQFQNRLNRVINHLESQQAQISKNLILARNCSARKDFIIFKEIFKIHFNLDFLKSHLEDIFEAIRLAKIQILSKNILSSQELGFATTKLEEKGVVLDTLEETYDFLELSAFHNHSKIIFAISVPLLENLVYENFFLEPMPVGNKILKMPPTHAMRGNDSTFIVTRECKRIQKRRLCDPGNLINITNDGCIPELLQGLSANCSFTNCINPTEMKLIMENFLVLKSVRNLQIDSSCGITKRNLTGSYLLEFHNCSIYVNGSTFENTELIATETPVVLPLDGLSISLSHFEPTRRLEEIHIANRKFLEDFVKSHRIGTYSSMTISTLSFLIVIILIVILGWKTIPKFRAIFRNVLRKRKDVDTTNHQKRSNFRNETNRDDSFSKGGVVKDHSSRPDASSRDLAHRLSQVQQQQQQVAVTLDSISRHQSNPSASLA